MEERNEDKFLKKAFANINAIESPAEDFNQLVMQKALAGSRYKHLLIKFLKVFVPILFFGIGGGILLYIYNAEQIKSMVSNYLPMLKPWHIFVVFLLVYFHFVRSLLILTFVYLRKRFTFANPFA